ncbi:DUF6220 domain-containing protein [Elstera litoralis]|uniref:DUF6220 domain-containing protein n=1 Tax=Elstera litoralis TaxID=552518 RepID=UPI00069767CD|nr:DUF6220 domain-containing protein [Elstera litoralis]
MIALAAYATLIGLFGQFALAGLSLFADAALWEGHVGLGFLLMLPIGALLIGTQHHPRHRPLRWWALVTALLYCLQILWMILGEDGPGLFKALHVANAPLLLMAAFVLATKIERRAARDAAARDGSADSPRAAP